MGNHRFFLIALGALCMALTACHQPLSSAGRKDKRPDWDRVRARVLYQLADKQFNAHQFSDAAKSLLESLALDPSQADTYAALARSYLELGKAVSAEQVLRAAADEDVMSAEIAYLQGVVLESRDSLEPAIARFEAARSMDGHNVDYIVAQVECLVVLGREAEALALLDKHASSFNEDATISTLAGYIELRLGNEDQAVRRLRQASLSHNDIAAAELGLLLAKQGRFVEALWVLKPLVESDGGSHGGDGNDGAIRTLTARCYLAVGDAASAKSVLAKYADLNHQDVETQLLYGYAALASDDLPTAWLALDRAERQAANTADVQLFLALAQRKQGSLSEAAKTLWQLLRQAPDSVDAHCLLAEVLRDRKDERAARAQFERALAIDPDCGWAKVGLAQLTPPSSSYPPPNPNGRG